MDLWAGNITQPSGQWVAEEQKRSRAGIRRTVRVERHLGESAWNSHHSAPGRLCPRPEQPRPGGKCWGSSRCCRRWCGSHAEGSRRSNVLFARRPVATVAGRHQASCWAATSHRSSGVSRITDRMHPLQHPVLVGVPAAAATMPRWASSASVLRLEHRPSWRSHCLVWRSPWR